MPRKILVQEISRTPGQGARPLPAPGIIVMAPARQLTNRIPHQNLNDSQGVNWKK